MKDIVTKAKNMNVKELANILGFQFSNLFNTRKASSREFYYLSLGVAYAKENNVLFNTQDKIKIVCTKKPEALKYVKENNLKWTDYIILSNFKNLEMVSFKKDLSDVVFLSNDLLLQEIKELEKIRC